MRFRFFLGFVMISMVFSLVGSLAYADSNTSTNASDSSNFLTGNEVYNQHLDKVSLDTAAKEWNNKGYSLFKEGKYNESIEAYNEALKIYPNNTVYLQFKGDALFNIGNYTGALEVYEKAYNVSVGGNPKGLARDGIMKTTEILNITYKFPSF